MTGIAGFRLPIVVLILVLSTGLVAGLSGCCSTPQPGFVGVPEAIERSPDYTLMLAPHELAELRDFLALDGNRFLLEAGESPLPGDLARVDADYGPLLTRLAGDQPVTTRDLDAGSAFRSLFDGQVGVLTVHDARVGWDENGEFFDLVADRAVALVRGQFVFAFYLRRLQGAEVVLPAGSGDGVDAEATPSVVWTLTGSSDEISTGGPHAYSGLVVFRKAFAIPGKGH